MYISWHLAIFLKSSFLLILRWLLVYGWFFFDFVKKKTFSFYDIKWQICYFIYEIVYLFLFIFFCKNAQVCVLKCWYAGVVKGVIRKTFLLLLLLLSKKIKKKNRKKLHCWNHQFCCERLVEIAAEVKVKQHPSPRNKKVHPVCPHMSLKVTGSLCLDMSQYVPHIFILYILQYWANVVKYFSNKINWICWLCVSIL